MEFANLNFLLNLTHFKRTSGQILRAVGFFFKTVFAFFAEVRLKRNEKKEFSSELDVASVYWPLLAL